MRLFSYIQMVTFLFFYFHEIHAKRYYPSWIVMLLHDFAETSLINYMILFLLVLIMKLGFILNYEWTFECKLNIVTCNILYLLWRQLFNVYPLLCLSTMCLGFVFQIIVVMCHHLYWTLFKVYTAEKVCFNKKNLIWTNTSRIFRWWV